jgi:hypothetical protein
MLLTIVLVLFYNFTCAKHPLILFDLDRERRSAHFVHRFVRTGMDPIDYNNIFQNKAFNNIEKSRASFKQRKYYKVFLIFSKVLVLASSIIFEAYYPSLIFVSRDRERFFTEFVIAKDYIIPWLDAATFILSLLHLFLIYQTRTFETEFFEAT